MAMSRRRNKEREVEGRQVPAWWCQATCWKNFSRDQQASSPQRRCAALLCQNAIYAFCDGGTSWFWLMRSACTYSWHSWGDNYIHKIQTCADDWRSRFRACGSERNIGGKAWAERERGGKPIASASSSSNKSKIWRETILDSSRCTRPDATLESSSSRQSHFTFFDTSKTNN